MDRKERVLAYILSSEYVPLTFQELELVLDVPRDQTNELKEILDELENECKVMLTKKGRYMADNDGVQRVIGTLRCNPRGFFGFVMCEDKSQSDIFISGKNIGNALDKDKVLVKIIGTETRNNQREGQVIKIIERGNDTVVGVVKDIQDGKCEIQLDNERIYKSLYIHEVDSMEANIGDRVAAKITKYYDDGSIYGIVESVLGDSQELKSNIMAVLYEQNVKLEFDEATIKHAESIEDEIDERDLKGRLDLRDEMIFTIDGDDARDFDDAVSIEILENGNYKLGVHIADVTNYVKEGTPLDNEAFERGTSVYLPDRVIPMLPKRLSNGICSLNPNVDRLTLSIFMEINTSGDVVSHELHETVIKSIERMTYNNVAVLLEGNDEGLLDRYEHIMPTLKTMQSLAAILNERRIKRGSINFDFPESAIIVDDSGEPIEIAKLERKVSHKLIEEFMLIANETVAEYAFWAEIPFIYRVHEPPSNEKIEEFNKFIYNFGLRIKGKIDEDNPVHPKALQQVLDQVVGTPEEMMVSMYMLRSLMKARYTPENAGHFGLAAPYYSHFTSPIRRYPDLAIHRILKELINGRLSERRIEELKEFSISASEQSSEREIAAEMVERDVDDLMKVAYMQNFIGESFIGRVANVMSFGMFVELENSVEGLIRIDCIEGDYYIFDESNRQIVGKNKNFVFKVGDEIEVTLIKADLLSRQIDFILTRDATVQNIERIERMAKKKKREKQTEIDKFKKQKGRRTKNVRRGVKKTSKKRRTRG